MRSKRLPTSANIAALGPEKNCPSDSCPPLAQQRTPVERSRQRHCAWEKVRNGKILAGARKSAIGEIRAFLKSCAAKVPKAVRKPFVEAVSVDDDQFAEVVDTFEWAMGSGDHKDIQAEILQALEKSQLSKGQGGSNRVYRDMFAFVFHLLSEPGPKTLTQGTLIQRDPGNRRGVACRVSIPRLDR